MKMSLALTLVLFAASCASQPAAPPEPPHTRAEDEAAIRKLSQEWAAAAKTKDAAKFASFYTDDAVVMLEMAPDLTGPAIMAALGDMMKDPAFNLEFLSSALEVASSGDLA